MKFAKVMLNKMGWAPNPLTGVLSKGEMFESRDINRMKAMQDKGTNWSHATTSQGMPRRPSLPQKLRKP